MTIPCLGWRKAFRLHIGCNAATSSVEFRTIITIAWARKGAQPLLGGCLQHGGSRAHDLAAFAATIAESADLSHTTAWGRKFRGSDQARWRATWRVASTSKTSRRWPERSKRPPTRSPAKPCVEVVVELLAQGVQAGPINVGQEAAEGGAMGELVPSKKGHEWVSEGTQAVEEGLDCRLTTERIAKQDGDEVDDVIVTSAHG